jgi:hypothetical protein
MQIPEGGRMKIWYDALTGKHVRYGVAIARHLRRSGHAVMLTTRKHPDTLEVAKFLDEELGVVGKYNPKSLLTRLETGLQRQLEFCRLSKDNPFDAAVSHGSVDECRVAFGLGKPVITTVDTPYADAVHRLTLPLTNYIVASNAIPKEKLQVYNPKAEVIGFDSVDEVAWIKDFKPNARYDFGKPLIVVRQLEEKAAYTKSRVDLLALGKKLTKLGKIVFLSRYGRTSVKGLTIPKEYVDSASLVAQADLFIGVGGTITREAALQGTPAIVIKIFQDQQVNDFLTEKGFPIYNVQPSDAFKLAERLLGKKHDVKHLLAELENPVEVIERIVNRIRRN